MNGLRYSPDDPYYRLTIDIRIALCVCARACECQCMCVTVCVNARVVFERQEAQPGVDSGSSLYHSGYSFCSAHWREILFFPFDFPTLRQHPASGKLAHECTKQHTSRKLKHFVERNGHSINRCRVSSANATRAMLGRDLPKIVYWVF